MTYAKRRIIQITGVDGQCVALCNDGTVWTNGLGSIQAWYQQAPIPQDGFNTKDCPPAEKIRAS